MKRKIHEDIVPTRQNHQPTEEMNIKLREYHNEKLESLEIHESLKNGESLK